MDESKYSKKNLCFRYRWPILIVILTLIAATILTTILIVRAKYGSQPSVIDTSDTASTNQKHNVR